LDCGQSLFVVMGDDGAMYLTRVPLTLLCR
jgi:hypothetical protein